MFRIPAFLILLLALGCKGDPSAGDKVTLDGFLFSAVTGQTVNVSEPTISAFGYDVNSFKVDYLSTSVVPGAIQFKIHDLPYLEAVTFDVSGGSLDPTATLPITIDAQFPVEIGVLPSGATNYLIALAQQTVMSGVTINVQTQAIILGTVQPRSTCTVRSVNLLDPATGLSVLQPSTNGPFYFDSNGAMQIAAGFIPGSECNYIIFNVLPGRYVLRFNSDATTQDMSMVALGGKVMVGYNVPRQ